jgi:hypothetical protein
MITITTLMPFVYAWIMLVIISAVTISLWPTGKNKKVTLDRVLVIEPKQSIPVHKITEEVYTSL